MLYQYITAYRHTTPLWTLGALYNKVCAPAFRLRMALAPLLAWASLLCACGQSFGWTWIEAAGAEAGQQYWFRRTYTRLGALSRATLCVATTGYVQVYVNGRRVCTDPLVPLRAPFDGRPLSLSFDVTPYARPDTVTVAVWYAPAPGVPVPAGGQVAARMYGADADGHAFSVHSDGGWLCRPAPGGFQAGQGWWADGAGEMADWTNGQAERALWRNAMEVPPAVCGPVSPVQSRCRVRRVARASLAPHGGGVSCRFPYPLYGLLRATLRGARHGATLRVGPWLRYVCSGEMDEQPCLRFSPLRLSGILIEGGAWLTPEVVQGVEALELEPLPCLTF